MALKRSGPPKRRSRLKPRGKRAEREAEAVEAFRRRVLRRAFLYFDDWRDCQDIYKCERCGDETPYIDAHHMASKGVAPGHPLLHDAEANGAALCGGPQGCHRLVTDHACEDWPRWCKSLAWLNAGGRLAEHDMEEETDGQ